MVIRGQWADHFQLKKYKGNSHVAFFAGFGPSEFGSNVPGEALTVTVPVSAWGRCLSVTAVTRKYPELHWSTVTMLWLSGGHVSKMARGVTPAIDSSLRHAML